MILLSIYDINQWHVVGFLSILAAAAVYGVYYIVRALVAGYKFLNSI
jgi:hypothetical protein